MASATDKALLKEKSIFHDFLHLSAMQSKLIIPFLLNLVSNFFSKNRTSDKISLSKVCRLSEI